MTEPLAVLVATGAFLMFVGGVWFGARLFKRSQPSVTRRPYSVTDVLGLTAFGWQLVKLFRSRSNSRRRDRYSACPLCGR